MYNSFVRNFLSPVTKPTKNTFDYSSSHAFSSHFGLIEPVKVIPTVPNQHIRGSVSSHIEGIAMTDDNFTDIRANYKAVFVPYQAIFGRFDNSLLQNREQRVNQLYPSFHQYTFNLVSCLQYIFIKYFLYRIAQEMASYLPANKDMYEGGADSGQSLPHWIKAWLASETGGRSTYHCLYAFCNTVVSHLTLNPINFNVDSDFRFVQKFYFENANSQSIWPLDALRQLDMLGYGNYLPVFESEFQQALSLIEKFDEVYSDKNVSKLSLYIHAVFSVSNNSYTLDSVNPGPYLYPCLFSDLYFLPSSYLWNSHTFTILPDEVPLARLGFVRLIPQIDGYDSEPQVKYVSVLPLFAWKYYISFFERSNYRSPSTSFLTLDNMSEVLSLASEDDLSEYLISSLDFAAVNQFDNLLIYNFDALEPCVLFLYLLSSDYCLLEQDMYTSSQLSVVSGTVPTTTTTALTTNLVKSLNDVSALYSLREQLLRAGVKRSNQYKAVFGSSPSYDITLYPSLLGSEDSDIKVIPVVSQSETEGAELGKLASRSMGHNQNVCNFSFDSQDFGIIFIVQCIKGTYSYENFGISRLNTQLVSDLFVPAYNNLGLEPLYKEHLSLLDYSHSMPVSALTGEDYSDSHRSYMDFYNSSPVIGFTSRYSMYKDCIPSLVHGLFSNFGVVPQGNNWNVDSYSEYARYSSAFSNTLLFSGYRSSLINQQVDGFSGYQNLYMFPWMFNGLFSQIMDNLFHADQSFDQFKCFVKCNVTLINPMPKIGLYQRFTNF